jgi:putative transposase
MIRKAFKYRLKDKRRLGVLKGTCGCSRFVWNKALALQKDRLGSGRKLLSYKELCAELTTWKRSDDFHFLREANAQGLQQTLKQLDRAIRDGLDPKQPSKRFPTFKKKGRCRDSFHVPVAPRLDGNRIFIPKIGWCPFWRSRPVEGTPKNFTISNESGRWFVSIQVEIGEAPAPPSTRPVSPVGLDLGVRRHTTTSNGDAFEFPSRRMAELENERKRLQKALSRKTKFGSNWWKNRKRLAGSSAKIARVRNDWLHKSSTRIIKNHDAVFVEDLRVVNMTASAKGSIENPGKNVKAKSGLNRAILDKGWSEFARMLEYKCDWAGKTFLRVDPKHTSQKCSKCGHVHADNRTSQSRFMCVACGFEMNADVNAAKNILEAGLSLLGDMGRHEAA